MSSGQGHRRRGEDRQHPQRPLAHPRTPPSPGRPAGRPASQGRDPAIREAPYAIDEHIRKAELKDLRQGVLARDYFIISPINPMNPMNPPSPEDMERMAAAMRTLDDLGLIITL